MGFHRILIQTHHITSRKKIATITKAAKRLECSVLLKTGRSPGIMIAESEFEDGSWVLGSTARAVEWGEVVRKLRYKDFKLLRKEEFAEKEGRLKKVIELGSVMEVERVQDVKDILERCGEEELWKWWSGRAKEMGVGGLLGLDDGKVEGKGK